MGSGTAPRSASRLFRSLPTALALVGSLACGTTPGQGGSSETPLSTTDQASLPVLHPAHHRSRLPNGLLPGMMPRRTTAPSSDGVARTVSPTCRSPKLSYFGGPIVMSPTILAVFWNSNVNAQVQANMAQFYADVTVSSYWPWLQEYDTVGLSGGTEQAILSGTSGGSFTLTPTHCPAAQDFLGLTTCRRPAMENGGHKRGSK